MGAYSWGALRRPSICARHKASASSPFAWRAVPVHAQGHGPRRLQAGFRSPEGPLRQAGVDGQRLGFQRLRVGLVTPGLGPERLRRRASPGSPTVDSSARPASARNSTPAAAPFGSGGQGLGVDQVGRPRSPARAARAGWPPGGAETPHSSWPRAARTISATSRCAREVAAADDVAPARRGHGHAGGGVEVALRERAGP